MQNTNFGFFMPAEIKSGRGCVGANASLFALGKKCLIVTGKSSAVKSGAQGDVTAALDKNGIGYEVFNKVGANPLMSICFEGGRAARECGADFIVGIGGGSALDAAKAVAAYAVNDIEPMAIFGDGLKPSLPLILIPTTAGTGSEVNPYSVLSIDGLNKKKTFKSRYSYAKYAFLDAKYTESLSDDITLSTALDAFAHCIESYLSPKSTAISRMFAVYGAKNILGVLEEKTTAFTAEDRDALMAASCAGGVAINTTGTGFPHPLGYNLTMYRGMSHGYACACFTGAYIDYNMRSDEGKTLLNAFAAETGYSLEEIKALTDRLAPNDFTLTEEEIALYVDTTASAGNYTNSPYVISRDEMTEIYRALFGKK